MFIIIIITINFTAEKNWKSEKKEYWIAYQESNSFKDLADYAAMLTYLGEYQNAKNIYHNLEKRHPDLYRTASNLGTIYELIGKPDSAYFGIKRSLELNPNSHHGSEWIHLKILNFKLSQSQDYSQSILGFDFGDNFKPKMEHDSLNHWLHHIEHQLQERTIFVKPKNKIVGNLYFDYGNLLALTTDLEAAIEAYEHAQEYGYNTELLRFRLKYFKKMAVEADYRNNLPESIKQLDTGDKNA